MQSPNLFTGLKYPFQEHGYVDGDGISTTAHQVLRRLPVRRTQILSASEVDSTKLGFVITDACRDWSFANQILGNQDSNLIGRSQSPIWHLREGWDWRPTKILFPMGTNQSSEEWIAFADFVGEFANWLDATLSVTYEIEPSTPITQHFPNVKNLETSKQVNPTFDFASDSGVDLIVLADASYERPDVLASRRIAKHIAQAPCSVLYISSYHLERLTMSQTSIEA